MIYVQNSFYYAVKSFLKFKLCLKYYKKNNKKIKKIKQNTIFKLKRKLTHHFKSSHQTKWFSFKQFWTKNKKNEVSSIGFIVFIKLFYYTRVAFSYFAIWQSANWQLYRKAWHFSDYNYSERFDIRTLFMLFTVT